MKKIVLVILTLMIIVEMGAVSTVAYQIITPEDLGSFNLSNMTVERLGLETHMIATSQTGSLDLGTLTGYVYSYEDYIGTELAKIYMYVLVLNPAATGYQMIGEFNTGFAVEGLINAGYSFEDAINAGSSDPTKAFSIAYEDDHTIDWNVSAFQQYFDDLFESCPSKIEFFYQTTFSPAEDLGVYNLYNGYAAQGMNHAPSTSLLPGEPSGPDPGPSDGPPIDDEDASVPEPATVLLIASMLMGFGLLSGTRGRGLK